MYKEYKIEGMSCGHCVMAVKKELAKLNLAETEVEIGSAKVTFNETEVNSSEIENAISKAGYRVIKKEG